MAKKVKILNEDRIKVYLGIPTKDSVVVSGDPGPVGPTGPPGGSNYFYSNEAPQDANVGDKWFQPLTGIEFSRVQNQWVQLYISKNQKRLPVFTSLFLSGNTLIDEQTILNFSLINDSEIENVEWRVKFED